MDKPHKGLPVDSLKYYVWLSALLIAVFMVISPLYLLIKYAVSDSSSINTGGSPIPLWPYHATVRTFLYLFSDRQFYSVIINSIFIALGTVFLSMILGVPAAYVLARYRLPGRKLIILGLISVRLFPDIASIIPIAEFFIRLNLHNTYAGVILAHTLLALPYVIFIGMSAFETIPGDLEQQATVMGANGFQIFLFHSPAPCHSRSCSGGPLHFFIIVGRIYFFLFFAWAWKNFNAYALPETEINVLAAAESAGDDIGLFKFAGHHIFPAFAEIYDGRHYLGFGQIGGLHGGCRCKGYFQIFRGASGDRRP